MINSADNRVILMASSGQEAPIRLSVNKRARRILLRIDPKAREAVLVVPSARQKNRALEFAKQRIDWVIERLDTLPDDGGLEFGTSVPLRGINHQIKPANKGRSVRAEEIDGEPTILVPGRPEAVQTKIIGFLRASARLDLSARVAVHARTLDVQPNGIAIKDTRTRWGSCSSAGNLNFSWRLICAPADVLDYVAAHEVAHLLEMNHSSRFWAHVERCTPEHKAARKWLNAHGRQLHAIGN